MLPKETDWRENPAAFTKFTREHQAPSIAEYAEYPGVTSTRESEH